MKDERRKDDRRPRENKVKYKVLKSMEIKYGNNKFIEVARKEVTDQDNNKSQFLGISKGKLIENNIKKYNDTFSIPLDKSILEFVVMAINSCAQDEKKAGLITRGL